LTNNKYLITGGLLNHDFLNETYELIFDKENNFTKIKKANLKFKRCNHCSIAVNNQVYIMGGRNKKYAGVLNKCERFDVETNEWNEISSMKRKRSQFSCTNVMNKYIYCFGGFKERNIFESSVERYSINDNKWRLTNIKLDLWK